MGERGDRAGSKRLRALAVTLMLSVCAIFAPQAQAATITASEGDQFSAVVGSTAPGTSTATIDWGDGTALSPATPDPATGEVTGTHTYAEEGTYHGTLNWNSGGQPQMTGFDVTVTDGALTSTTFSQVYAGAGVPVSGPVAKFTDADPGGTASDYTATINWGDGSSSNGTVSGPGEFTVSGSHTYANPGTYPVSVSIKDAGGATTTANGTATVSPQAQPVVTTSAPSVTSTTSAALSATVNPEGLATRVDFEYGPALAAARDVVSQLPLISPQVTYTSTTPARSIRPDFSDHMVTATVIGLLPNTTYHFRVVATNSDGTTTGPDQTLTTPADPKPPPPVLGKSVDVTPVAGLVLVKLPNNQSLYAADAGARLSSTLTKGHGFVPLTEARQLPSGTQIDARLGTIRLLAATGKSHKTQSGTFSGALFGFAQDRLGVNKGLTTLSLVEGAFPGAPTYASCRSHRAGDQIAQEAGLSSAILQTLHAKAHGRFRTRGRYAAATVRGTAWTITDRCNGTLVVVKRHTVAVTDFVRHITILVRQGHSYLARASRRG